MRSHLQGSLISISGEGMGCTSTAEGLNKQSQFYIGSLSKQMTTFLLLNHLQQQDPDTDLSTLLDQTLADTFPASTLLHRIDESWIEEVTLLDLLTHQSGLSDYMSPYYCEHRPEELNVPVDPIALFQSITFDPSKAYLYSNTNYFLLGKLLEEAYDTSFTNIFNQTIKEPANLTASYALTEGNYPTLKHIYPQLATNQNDTVLAEMSNVIGAGTVISSSDDLLKWNEYLFKEADPALRDPMLGNYGLNDRGETINLGLTTVSTPLGPLISHRGGLDSYRSLLGYFPDEDLHIIILSNDVEEYDQLIKTLREWYSHAND